MPMEANKPPNVIAALDAKNSLDKLFPEESQEKEKCEEAPEANPKWKYIVVDS